MRRRKPNMTTVRYADRYEAELIAQARRFCDAFGQWRTCGNKRCRRERACRGNERACLNRALASVPREVQRRVRQDILEATPGNIGGPERAVRLLVPLDFFDGAGDRYAIQEMKRLRKAGKLVEGGDNANLLRLRLVEAGR